MKRGNIGHNCMGNTGFHQLNIIMSKLDRVAPVATDPTSANSDHVQNPPIG